MTRRRAPADAPTVLPDCERRVTSAIDLCLASGSPRRQALLDQVQLQYTTCAPDIDESARAGETPQAMVARLAIDKALAGQTRMGADRPVLAADTAVVLDGEALGKPADAADACAMLARLSGRRHSVCTGVAVANADAVDQCSVTSHITLRATTEGERRGYWATGEPADKAGAYAIQGLGAALVAHLEGSYSNVVGLPLFETLALLRDQGVDPFARSG